MVAKKGRTGSKEGKWREENLPNSWK